MTDETMDSGTPIAPQQDFTSRPPVAPDMGSSTGGAQDPAAVVGGPGAPVAPAGTQSNRDPNAVPGTVEPHHGLLMQAFQDIAGGKKTTYRQSDAGPVAVKENLQPGEIARNILAAALTGLAGGFKTRGGPGGNKGQAATAGFEAEQKRESDQKNQNKQQAQQEFQNKNIADEMTLRKASNARDQQRSIEASQEHALHMDQAKQSLEQGKTEFAERTLEFEQKQTDRVNLLKTLGAEPLKYPDGTMVPEFNSPEEAADWANKNPSLAISPGKYNTVFEVDPVTNRYMIMKKPLGWDDPQRLGVKLDPKTKQPVTDKEGNMIPDGTFKGPDGKPAAPAGLLTPHQLFDSQERVLDLRNKELSRMEALERLKNMRRERAKDEQQTKADDEFNRAQGNPDAIDDKTGNFILSPSSRTILQQRFIKEAAAEQVIINSAQREMDRVGFPGTNATVEEKQQYNDMQQQASEARSNLHQYQVNMGLLSRTPNVADITANNVRQSFTKDDGSYDEKGALASVDKLTAPSAVKQQIRNKLSLEPQNRPPAQLDAVIGAIASLPPEQQVENINKAPLSKHDKDYLFSKLKTDSSKINGLDQVSPNLTVLRGTDGKNINVSNGDVEQWKQKGYTVIGQGTAGTGEKVVAGPVEREK